MYHARGVPHKLCEVWHTWELSCDFSQGAAESEGSGTRSLGFPRLWKKFQTVIISTSRDTLTRNHRWFLCKFILAAFWLHLIEVKIVELQRRCQLSNDSFRLAEVRHPWRTWESELNFAFVMVIQVILLKKLGILVGWFSLIQWKPLQSIHGFVILFHGLPLGCITRRDLWRIWAPGPTGSSPQKGNGSKALRGSWATRRPGLKLVLRCQRGWSDLFMVDGLTEATLLQSW